MIQTLSSRKNKHFIPFHVRFSDGYEMHQENTGAEMSEWEAKKLSKKDVIISRYVMEPTEEIYESTPYQRVECS